MPQIMSGKSSLLCWPLQASVVGTSDPAKHPALASKGQDLVSNRHELAYWPEGKPGLEMC